MAKKFLKTFGAIVLLVLSCWWCFSNGVGTGYLFDDGTSVRPLQILRADPGLFWYVVFGDSSGPLGRPIAVFTFALEQVLFEASSDFSQRVSIAVHTLNALLCFALLLQLLRLENVRGAALLALLGGLFWACSPQKVSTVLYIVQRMAALACLFTLLGLNSYVLARTTQSASLRLKAATVCALSVFAAPFAKETGALLIFYLAVLELLVMGPKYGDRLRIPSMMLLLIGFMAFCALGMREFAQADVRYAVRSFSIDERLLSLPVVLLDYFYQFFVPNVGTLGLLHDDYGVVTSTADLVRFWMPLTLIVVAFAFIARTVRRRESSLPAFGLAFFFLGHSLEGSFVPLEIFFEHRNYIPSVGLVIALLGVFSLPKVKAHRIETVHLATLAVGLAVLSLAFATWNFSARWNTSESLLEHHLAGHPRSSRVHSEYALLYAGAGRYREAMESAQLAFDLSNSEPAARSLGVGDLGALRAVVACLAGEPITNSLPEIDDAVTANPFRSAAVRSLHRMVSDEICPDDSWDELSVWLGAVVAAGEQSPQPIKRFKASSLQDLANLELALEHYSNVFVYASMGAEIRPDYAMFALLKYVGASQLGDSVSTDESKDQLLAFVQDSGIPQSELLGIRKVAPQLFNETSALLD